MTLRIPMSAPEIVEDDIRAVEAVLRTPNLSMGPEIQRFEHQVAAYIGTRHAVAVSSGTAGLHLCVIAAGVGPGDEVITTPFSFIASANCILYEGARPVFVDIDPRT
jgi:perosamine synthetase